ncbi:MAG TPA: hypothetical protein VH351_02880 [Bryobacteraceae bacterium]|jgi:hypothetical protein|nr:hypothetical protein [Bryobacteraceae bacterium]
MIKDQAAGMQTVMAPNSQKDGAFYVRWNPDLSPYTIELKLELVRRIAEEIERASGSGQEIGGVLLGSFPAGSERTLRIEEVTMIPRTPEDGPVFLPNPKQYRNFVEQGTRELHGRVPVGVFRTHKRNAPPRPSLADQTMVAAICPNDLGALLLIEGDDAANASLFLRTAQPFPDRPAIAPFSWNARELAALPELSDTPAVRRSGPDERLREPRRQSRKSLFVAAAVLCAMIAAAGYAWSGIPIGESFAASPLVGERDDNPHLAVNGDRVLSIVWNRHSSLVQRASSAKLLIVDGQNAREITLGANELRSGAVEYERTSHTVQVMLVLSMPGDFSVTQIVAWRS